MMLEGQRSETLVRAKENKTLVASRPEDETL